MALKLHCIFNQPSVLPELVRIVEKQAHKLNKAKKSAKVEDVYRELRDAGFEIDIESVAFAYENVPNIIGRKGFSTQADINRAGGAGLKRAVEVASKGGLNKQKLGRYSINTAVANSIASTFAGLQGKNDVDTSRLKELENAMRRYASSLLDKSAFQGQKTQPTFKETLERYFDVENLSLTNQEAMKGRIKGNLNKIEDMWNAIKDDVDKISAGIKDKVARAKFDQMTAALKNSNYEMLLSTSEADRVIKDILKAAGYTKQVTVKGVKKDVVDWNKALKNQADWKKVFTSELNKAGFTQTQSTRIVDKLEANYNKALQKQATNALNTIRSNNNLPKQTVKPDAVRKLMRLRNAGIFAPSNSQYLRDALGVSIPQNVADHIADIIRDFDENTKATGRLSNVESEEVYRAISLALSPFTSKGIEKAMNVFSDYAALRASSTISTIFNATQNITSGINASVYSTISAAVKTRNLKVLRYILRGWGNAFIDVAAGGVTIRDSRTKNALEQLQGRGGLSDRWTWDAAKGKGFFGYAKMIFNGLGQITATAIDAANGTAIYHAQMVQAVSDILVSRGMTRKEANRKVDDIVFGTNPASGKTYASEWREEAKKRLQNQTGVVDRDAKAFRIADELLWHQLVTTYGLTVDEVKAAMSASIRQKSRSLGHESDVYLNPSLVLQGASELFQRNAREAKDKGNRGRFAFWTITDTVFKTINMFAGGKANWAILTLQNSPFGIAQGLFDLAYREASSGSWGGLGKGSAPLYRQPLAIGNAEKLRDQLEERRGIQGRFERGITGTVIQLMLYAGVMAMWDDDEEENQERSAELVSMFDSFYDDPNTRRFADKALPALLAAELMFAYDKKTGKFKQDRISNSVFLPKFSTNLRGLWEFGSEQVIGETSAGHLRDQLKWNKAIKDEEERNTADAEAIMMYVGNLVQVPYTAWFNIERKEMRVFSNGFTPDPKERDRQKEEYKKQLSNVDGAVDAILKGAVTPTIIESLKGESSKSTMKFSAAHELFDDRGIPIPKAGSKSSISLEGYRYNKETHPNGEMTDEEYERFSQLKNEIQVETLDKLYASGVKIKKNGTRRTVKMEAMSDEQLKKVMSKVSEVANEKAKERIFGKKKKTQSGGSESVVIE